MIKYQSYYQTWKTKHHQHSIDAYFKDGIWSVSLSLFAIQAANKVLMTIYDLAPPRQPTIHNLQWLRLHWRSFLECGRVRVSVHVDYQGSQYIENKQWCTNVRILQLAVAYLNVMINSETRNAEQEIEAYGSSETGQNPWVDGYRSGCGPQRGRGLGSFANMEPNWPVFAVQTWTAGRLPGPVANSRWDLQ